MTFKHLSVLCLAAMVFASPARAGICHTQNLMPDFFAFEAQTAVLTPERRADLFVKTFMPRYRVFYGSDNFADAQKARRAAADLFAHKLPAAFSGFAPLTDARLRAVAAAIIPAFDKAQNDFVRTFADFRCETPIGFGPSLMHFDGNGYSDAQGHEHMRFGIDTIAVLHPPGDMPALFAHELFHLYHAQILQSLVPDGDVTWWDMWEEGLATYVSQQLNAPKSDQQVLWIPQDLVARMRAPGIKQRAAAEMLAAFDKSDGTTHASFFQFTHSAPGLPPRAGYFLGLRMAQKLGRTRSLQQLAHLTPAQVKPLAKAFLEEQGH